MKKNSFLSIVIVAFFWFNHSLIFSQCENFEMTIGFMNPTCPGYSDGSISVNQTGGTGMVSGEITNSEGQMVLNGGLGTTPNILVAGWYYVYLVDEMGCELYDSVYIADPDELEIVLTITLPSSISACDGIAEVDTVLNYGGDFNNLAYYWTGGPGGLGETVKSDLCYGDYSLIVNNEIGCSTSHPFSVGNLSAEKVAHDEKVFIYPNPFSEYTTIHVPSSLIGETMLVYNQLGELVRSVSVTADVIQVDRSGLPDGLYFCQIGDYQTKLFVQD